MIHPTPTTELEDQQDSMLPDISTALVPIHSIAWKTAQHFSYGARGFMRVPVSEANDLNYLLGVLFKAVLFTLKKSRLRKQCCE
jgi:hypothetical protein